VIEKELRELRAQAQRALDHYDIRTELYTNDADCAAGMADILRAALVVMPFIDERLKDYGQ